MDRKGNIGICFMCGVSFSSRNLTGDDDELSKCPTLKNSLNVIFVLRKLLEVSRSQIADKLRETGDNPEDWIRFCDKCTEIIKNARELDEEIVFIGKELRQDKKKMVEMIRTRSDDDNKSGKVAYPGNSFGDQIRAFVKQNSFVKKIKNATAEETSPVDIQKVSMPTKCFICNCNVTITTTKNTNSEKDSDKLGKNLDVIFVLKMILQVPHIYIETQYTKCGPDPVNWIKFCDHCSRLARTARKLDEDIRKIKKPLDSIQKDVTEKIKTLEFSQRDDCDGNSMTFEETIGSYVKQKTYYYSDNSKLNPNPEEYLISLKDSPKIGNSITVTGSSQVEPEKVKWTPRSSRITEDDKFECGSCGKIYRFAKYWSEHQWKGHKIKDIPCPVENCDMVLPSKLGDKFQSHWKTVHKAKRMEMETGSGPWICNICNVEKCTKQRLAYHRKMVHGVGIDGKPLKICEGPWICEMCGVEKKFKQNLVNHLRKVHKVKWNGEKVENANAGVVGSYICSYCGKGFSRASNHYTHVKYVHERRYDLSCHVCGLRVISRHVLNTHLLWKHEGDPEAIRLGEEEGLKLSRCEVVGCKTKFLSKETLERHVEKMHRGGGGNGEGGEGEVRRTRFECKVCGKGFWEGWKFRKHERTHDKGRERSWRCEVCGSGFMSKDNLRNHRNKVHRKKK